MTNPDKLPNTLQDSERRGAEQERVRILGLIDAELKDWNVYKTIPRISGVRSKGAVDALQILRDIITEEKK